MTNILTRPYEPASPEHLTNDEHLLWLQLNSDFATTAKVTTLLRNAAAAIKLYPGPSFEDGKGDMERQADLLVTAMALNQGPAHSPDASRKLSLDLRELGQDWAEFGDEWGTNFSAEAIHNKISEIAAYGVGPGREYDVADGLCVKLTPIEKIRGLFHARQGYLVRAWAPLLQADYARQAAKFGKIARFVFEPDVA